MVKAYEQIPIGDGEIPKTAIVTLSGFYGFLRISFGFRNTTQAFHRFIKDVLRGLNFVYALITGLSKDTNVQYLDLAFERLQEHSKTSGIEQCQIGTDSLNIVVYNIDAQGIRPL